MKLFISIICALISIFILMESLSLLNKGSLITPFIGITIIYILLYVLFKTNFFTNFKFKNK